MHGSIKFVRLIGVFLLLGGIAIFGLTATMNYYQGEMWAVTEHGKNVNRWSAVIIDAVGIVVIGFAAGAAFAAYKRAWGTFLTLIMLMSAVASINSMASFQATERMSASKTREAELGRIETADDLTKKTATTALAAAKDTRYRSVREDFLQANKEAIKSFRDAKVEVQVEPDAGAQLWATISGWSLDRIQMVQSAYLAVLLIILKMVCFQAAGFFLNPLAWMRTADKRSLPSSPKGGAGDGGNEVKSSENSKDEKPAREAEIHRLPVRADQLQAPSKVSAEPPRVSAPAPRPPVSLSLQPKYASVEEFLAMHPSVTSQKVIADAMGVSQAKVSRDIKRLKGRGKVKLDRNWRSNAVTFTPRRNGGLHALV